MIRRLMFSHHILSSSALIPKTISIGNIEMGGTGKTPLTIWLANYLEGFDDIGVILTRGYKRASKEKKSVQITPETLKKVDVNNVGDEPLLIAKKLKASSIVVGANRLEGYFSRPIIHRDDFVILDDGHQHLRIRRDLNIILINSTTEQRYFKCVPGGKLREGLSALMCADIIIFTKCENVASENERQLKSLISNYVKKSVIYGRVTFSPSYFENLKTGEKKPIIDFSSMNCGVFCGIAKPDVFFKTLKDLNINIREKITLDNHHHFKESSYRKINSLTSAQTLICTEKDAVKLNLDKIKGEVFSLVNEVVFLDGESRIKQRISDLMGHDHV